MSTLKMNFGEVLTREQMKSVVGGMATACTYYFTDGTQETGVVNAPSTYDSDESFASDFCDNDPTCDHVTCYEH